MRTSFDTELELPKLQTWFAENPHPSRQQVSRQYNILFRLKRSRARSVVRETDTVCFVVIISIYLFLYSKIHHYVSELNNLESRKGRKPLDVNNVVYWFKNARAAQKRAEVRGMNPGQYSSYSKAEFFKSWVVI